MSTNTQITQSPAMQRALLGYAVAEPEVYEHSVLFGVQPEFFSDPAETAIYKALQTFHQRVGRHPSLPELKSEPLMTQDDPRAVAHRVKILDEAWESRKQFGYDSIEPALREWAKSDAFIRGWEDKISVAFARGDTKAAFEEQLALSQRIERFDTITTGERFRLSVDRMGDAVKSIKDAKPPIKTGFKFFDDLTNGIRPQDLVVVSAPTGIGKTQIASIIASHAGANGHKVAFFALEAEDNEIELRTLYSTMNTIWAERHPTKEPLDYQVWLGGEYNTDPDVQAIQQEAQQLVTVPDIGKMQNVSTFYRRSGSYTIDDLTLDIVRKGRDHQLIVIDHLQYVDNDPNDKDQWAGVKKIMQKLSDLAFTYKVPIVLLAHIRKGDVKIKGRPLMSNLDDVFGSSDVTKIATKVLMLGRGKGIKWTSAPPPGMEKTSLTFARVGKNRTAGERTDVIGVVLYNRITGTYMDTWCPGFFSKNDTVWTPCESVPRWAKYGKKLLIETEEQS